LRDLGERRLKNLVDRAHFSGIGPGSAGRFPRSAHAGGLRHNLPIPTTSFVGLKEIAQVVERQPKRAW
jgi:hypothetical protein